MEKWSVSRRDSCEELQGLAQKFRDVRSRWICQVLLSLAVILTLGSFTLNFCPSLIDDIDVPMV
jgi:hypothetical protein